VDVVKIDVLALGRHDVLETMEACRPYGVAFLAEKVEDEVMLGRLADPAVTATDVEDVVRRDPALTYRLLRIANSAASGVTRCVSSVRDALVLVGVTKLRAWLVLLALDVGKDSSSTAEVGDALTRARTCELVARAAGTVRPDVAFTLGLLHGVALALGLPPGRIRDRLPSLAPDLSAGLAGESGPLRDVLDAVLAYERGDVVAAQRAGVPLNVLSDAYLAALAWTAETSRDVAAVDGLTV
jgi:c-di-GMP-related signal transduction protein